MILISPDNSCLFTDTSADAMLGDVSEASGGGPLDNGKILTSLSRSQKEIDASVSSVLTPSLNIIRMFIVLIVLMDGTLFNGT